MQFTRKDPAVYAWPVDDVIQHYLRGPNRGDRLANLEEYDTTVSGALGAHQFNIDTTATGQWTIRVSDDRTVTEHHSGWLVFDGKWMLMDSIEFWSRYTGPKVGS